MVAVGVGAKKDGSIELSSTVVVVVVGTVVV